MSLLVTGSIGIDTVRTPYGVSENCLGGSAVYFSLAASFFGPVRFTGVVGADCPFDLERVFAGRAIDLAGLEIRKGSRTFRWEGTYHGAMNERTTDRLDLNVLGEEPPSVPGAYRDSKFVFLANTSPVLQLRLLEQVDSPLFVAADTMDCWIKNAPDEVGSLLARIDCLIVNEQEARLLADDGNPIRAARAILDMGPGVVIVKKGESGSIMCNSSGDVFVLPAFPLASVKDPTGAGDSFAGGLMGYLAEKNSTDFAAMKMAVAYGTVVASFAICDFSVNGLCAIGRKDIEERLRQLRRATQF